MTKLIWFICLVSVFLGTMPVLAQQAGFQIEVLFVGETNRAAAAPGVEINFEERGYRRVTDQAGIAHFEPQPGMRPGDPMTLGIHQEHWRISDPPEGRTTIPSAGKKLVVRLRLDNSAAEDASARGGHYLAAGKAAELVLKAAAESKIGSETERDLASAEVARLYQMAGDWYVSAGSRASAVQSYSAARRSYQEALRLTNQDRQPELWASLKTDFASACIELAWRTDLRAVDGLLSEARKALEEALGVRKREKSPKDWAVTMDELGDALRQQGVKDAGPDADKLLAEAEKTYRAALEALPPQESPQQWAKAERHLANTLVSRALRLKDEKTLKRLGDAVEIYRNALKALEPEKLEMNTTSTDKAAFEWVKTERYLGNALRLIGQRTASAQGWSMLEEAAMHQRAVLEKLTDKTAPDEWAAAKVALADALEDQADRKSGQERVRLLREAVDSYEAATTIQTVDKLPQDFAATETDLGIAYKMLSELTEGKETTDLLDKAVDAWGKTLAVFTREQFALGWATATYNLAGGLEAKAKRSGTATKSREGFDKAVNLYKAVMEVHTEGRYPEDWADAQLSLSGTFWELAKRSGGDDAKRFYSESVRADQLALKIFTKENSPLKWALSQGDLATTLSDQADLMPGPERQKLLEQSADGHRRTLDVYTEDQFPEDWARNQNNLGTVLLDQARSGTGGNPRQFAKDAEGAFRKALNIYTRKDAPLKWAMATANLANALNVQAQHSSGEDSLQLLDQAIATEREAIKVYAPSGLSEGWAAAENSLGTMLMRKGTLSAGSNGRQALADAVSAYDDALKVRTREQSPLLWAGTKLNRASAMAMQGERTPGEKGKSLLEDAVKSDRELLDGIYGKEQTPQQWGMLQSNLGMHLMGLANRSESTAREHLLKESASAHESAMGVLNDKDNPGLWAYAQLNLCGAWGTLGDLKSGREAVELLTKAASACSAALRGYDPQQYPSGWASAQHNLGFALINLAERAAPDTRAENLKQAVNAFQAALRIRESGDPREWAMTENALGTALKRQARDAAGENKRELLAQSRKALEAALTIYTADEFPIDNAMALSNLTIVLTDEATITTGEESRRSLEQAIKIDHLLLDKLSKDHEPSLWASIQNNLAVDSLMEAKFYTASADDSRKLLLQAVEAGNAALEVYSPVNARSTWANSETLLGNTLFEVGLRSAGDESRQFLARAATAHSAALGAYPQGEFPEKWAEVQQDLATDRRELGARSSGQERQQTLDKAVKSYEALLKVQTQDKAPARWAGLQDSLGTTLRYEAAQLVQPTDKRELLLKSVAAYTAALEVRTQEHKPKEWASTHCGLGQTLFFLERWRDSVESMGHCRAVFPDFKAAYLFPAVVFEDRLFDFGQAISLNESWLKLHPDDSDFRGNLVGSLFDVGRFEDAVVQANRLLSAKNSTVQHQVGVRSLEIASLWALQTTETLPGKLQELIALVTAQAPDFKLGWTWRGPLHFVDTDPRLANSRVVLEELFKALDADEREVILRALRRIAENSNKP